MGFIWNYPGLVAGIPPTVHFRFFPGVTYGNLLGVYFRVVSVFLLRIPHGIPLGIVNGFLP